MIDQDLEKLDLKIVVADAYEMAKFDKDAFVKIRRMGFGGSDSSIILGVNPFTEQSELINQKLSVVVTDAERAVGEKESVRKGADLEPLILQKFEQWSGFDTYKPDAMYQLTKHPQLTVNFDGIIELQKLYIPVEAKYISPYANKYWDRSKSLKAPYECSAKICAGAGLADHIQQEATLYGIPPYYYTQVQHQMLALGAPFGYLVGLFDKGWELCVFKIFADKATQDALVNESKRLWEVVEERRNGGH